VPEPEIQSEAGFRRIMTYYNPKWAAVASVLTSVLASLSFPLFGYIFSEFLFLLMAGPKYNPNYNSDRNYWSWCFLGLAVGMGLVGCLKTLLFAVTGENLTLAVRCKLFTALIYKQVAWYDRKDKAPGIISNILSEDITNLNGLTTETVATILEAVLGICAGVGISAFFEWRMSLVCILATPFVLVGGMIMSRLNWKTGPGGK
jgi:ATP-binding cassette subfamily B (MDR/TAP) protein 1